MQGKRSTCLPAGAYQNLKFDENEPFMVQYHKINMLDILFIR